MTSWRGMWHIWYINVATAVYSCTLFNTIHSLVNYTHNYESRVSVRIITRLVLLPQHILQTLKLDVLQMCRFLKTICQINSLHQAVFLPC